jgi:hypothetical protein
MENKIENLYELEKAALEKKSLICPRMHGFHKPIPAAFVFHWQGNRILRAIKFGLYIYEEQGKEAQR